MYLRQYWVYLLWGTLSLALVVIMLGAYVRLSNAGLGCPDWPGCYGYFWLPNTSAEINGANAAYPDNHFVHELAFKEMLHRYMVGLLSMALTALLVMSFYLKRSAIAIELRWPILLFIILILQALLGMWTVTLKLMPIIVTMHLIGGLTIWVFLVIWISRALYSCDYRVSFFVFTFMLFTIFLLSAQIILGGWLSTNYAAFFCGGYPLCLGEWVPSLDFQAAFELWRPLHVRADGSLLPVIAYTTIHWVHRWFAVVVGLSVIICVKLLWHIQLRRLALLLLIFTVVQIILGIINVVAYLPITIAVLHNGCAALILALCCHISCRLKVMKK